MIKQRSSVVRDSRGFTLTEVMIASAISTVVLVGMIGLFISISSYWRGIELRMEADREANLAMSWMIYGVGDAFGLRAASLGAIQITPDGEDGWTVEYRTGSVPIQTNSVVFSAEEQTLTFNPGARVIGRDVATATVGRRGNLIDVSVRVEKTNGRQDAVREMATTVVLRNM